MDEVALFVCETKINGVEWVRAYAISCKLSYLSK
jgi:hypothetical protein